MKYWQLKNTEISLAESHFWPTWKLDFSQARSFCKKMLMDYKNFHFTPIPGKTNDLIFYTVFGPFLTISDHFCPMGIFFQKIQLCHTQLYMGP